MNMAEIRIALPYPLDSDANIKKFYDAVKDLFPKDGSNQTFSLSTGTGYYFSSQRFNSYDELRNVIYGKSNISLAMMLLYRFNPYPTGSDLTLEYSALDRTSFALKSSCIEYLETVAELVKENLGITATKEKNTPVTTGKLNQDAKKKKTFISHATKDCEYAKQLVNLLVHMGIKETDQIFCSSIGGTGIPLREHIYNHIKQEFQQFDIYVIMLLSENYYNSPACLNEMGATWILDLPDMPILLPGFSFSRIEGAEDNRHIAIKLDADDVKDKLLAFRDKVSAFFGIKHTNSAAEISIWLRHQQEFIDAITEIAKNPK